MKYLNLIPACHNYLKNNPDGPIILFSLAEQGCKERYPDLALTHEQLLNYFYGSGIIAKGDPAPEIDKVPVTDCFSIVTKYKCSFICQICPLSPRNKNMMETEESALLSFALSSPQNFDLLKSSGMESKMFQSLFLINPVPTGSLVSMLPLNRLVFFYLECTANTLTSFSSLPTDITAAIQRDNFKKLTQDNLKTINMYLKQMQKGCHEQNKDAIAAILKESYGLVPKINISSEKADETTSSEKKANQTFDVPKKEFYTKPIQNSKKLDRNKVGTIENKVVHSANTDCLEGFLTQSLSTESLDNKLLVQKNPALFLKKEPIKIKSIQSNRETPVSDKKEFFLPSCFSVNDHGGYPIISLSMNSSLDREIFQSFLLNHPKLALEVVTDSQTKEECLLFYGSNTFYILSCNDSEAARILSLFISKSPVRNQICFDPYRLYSYFSKHSLSNQKVFSLRAAYTALAKIQKRGHLKTIDEVILELTSRTNIHALPPYIFCMPYYLKMYDVITKHRTFQLKETLELFMNISSINTLLGISYDLHEYIDTPVNVSLFKLDEKLEYEFHYNKESMNMKSGIYSVTYTFANKHSSNNIAMDVLYHFARKELLMKFSYRLLAFHQDSFTIATKAEDYPHLCEIVVNIATHIATHKGLLPIYVSEERCPSENNNGSK